MTDTRTERDDLDKCRECGIELGAGYLCDDCDTIDFVGAKQ